MTLQGLRPLLGYLRQLGVVPEPAPIIPATPVERMVERYRGYLVRERSLAAGTVRYYERIARLFLGAVSADWADELALDELTTADVSRFVLAECRQRSVGSAKTVVAALRSLLRFLHVQGLTATPLVGAVPAVAPWRERPLPQYRHCSRTRRTCPGTAPAAGLRASPRAGP